MLPKVPAILTMTLALAFAAPADAKPKAEPKAKPSHDLRIVAVDVEGGAATLFVTPEGKSLLIDTGWLPGSGGQPPAPWHGTAAATSADKIVAAAHASGRQRKSTI